MAIQDTIDPQSASFPSAPRAGRPRIVPPVPETQPVDLPSLKLIRAFRTNTLASWPHRAFEEGVLERRVLGRPSYLLNDPGAIRRMLVENDANYTSTPVVKRILGPIVGDGLLLARGESWKRQRRTLAPSFTPRTLPILGRHVVLAAEPALDRLAAMAKGGGGCDLLEVLQALALDVAGRSMFSLETERFGPLLRGMIQHYNEGLARPRLTDFLPLGVPTLADLQRRRFRREWRALIDGIIAERRQAGRSGEARDLFDLMDEARDPETGEGFTPEQLRDQVASMITAGHETTALAMFWACWLLTLAPDAQDRVAEEARDVDLSPDKAHRALAQLPFTRAVVDETLRLFPPVFAIVRMSLGPDQLGPFRAPAGSIVMVAPWVIHRHRKLWSDPDAFDPDRFLPGAPPPPPFAFLPFGTGPHVCIGAQFATMEAVVVLAALVRRFRLSIPDGARPVLPVGIVTTQPDHSPSFRVSPR
ncbi:cytochrome P450 [Azospirillum sp. sgz302134]